MSRCSWSGERGGSPLEAVMCIPLAALLLTAGVEIGWFLSDSARLQTAVQSRLSEQAALYGYGTRREGLTAEIRSPSQLVDALSTSLQTLLISDLGPRVSQTCGVVELVSVSRSGGADDVRVVSSRALGAAGSGSSCATSDDALTAAAAQSIARVPGLEREKPHFADATDTSEGESDDLILVAKVVSPGRGSIMPRVAQAAGRDWTMKLVSVRPLRGGE